MFTGNGGGMFFSYVKCLSTHLWPGAVTYDKHTTVLISHIAEYHQYVTTWECRVLTMEEKPENAVMRFVLINGKIVYFKCCVGVKHLKAITLCVCIMYILENRILSLYHRHLNEESVKPLWAFYQIRKIAGCACAGNAGDVFRRHRLQRKPLVSDPGMHHGTCVTHVSWCMSGSLSRGGGQNVPGIPGACVTHNFTYLVRGPWYSCQGCHTINLVLLSKNLASWYESTQ